MKRRIAKFLKRVGEFFSDAAEKNLFLTGQMAAKTVRAMHHISSLSDVEFRVYSQLGEDGVIDWLVERLKVHVHAFVEFGVNNYIESNTRFLLANRNWRGLVMDGDSRNIETIRSSKDFWKYDLTAKCAFIDRDNVNDLIASSFRGEIGILSIDIDGNDYWVLEKIDVVSPIILICEFNSIFGDVWPVSVPYDPVFHRPRAHYSHLFWGASIAAFRTLAEKKGYVQVGTTAGVNVFFVRKDYADRLSGAIDNREGVPSHVRDSKSPSGAKTYLAGVDRLKEIAHMKVVNVETGETVTLGSLDPIYSESWKKELHAGSI